VTTVDIDERTLQISQQFFGFDGHEETQGGGQQRVVIADAATHMRRVGSLYDLVAVDCFESTTIPEACKSEAFYTAVKGVLAPNGTFMQNVLDAADTDRERLKDVVRAGAGVLLEDSGHRQWMEGRFAIAEAGR